MIFLSSRSSFPAQSRKTVVAFAYPDGNQKIFGRWKEMRFYFHPASLFSRFPPVAPRTRSFIHLLILNISFFFDKIRCTLAMNIYNALRTIVFLITRKHNTKRRSFKSRFFSSSVSRYSNFHKYHVYSDSRRGKKKNIYTEVNFPRSRAL